MAIKELAEKREKLLADARTALDEVGKNTDESRAAELEKRHDDIMVEFDKVEKLIEREQRLVDAEARISARAEEERKRNRPTGSDTDARAQDEGKKPEYREVFYKYLSTGASLDELTGEERAVLKEGVKLAAEQRTQVSSQGTSTTAGGYTVPVELSNQIIKSMKAY